MIDDKVAQSCFLADVRLGAVPMDAEFADRLPDWLLDPTFVALLNTFEEHGRQFRHRTPAQRRMALRIELIETGARFYEDEDPTICLEIAGVLQVRPLAEARRLVGH